jgi:hypothetical protein
MGGPLGSGNGYLDRREWRQRQDGYLRFATEQLDPTSVPNVLAHAGHESGSFSSSAATWVARVGRSRAIVVQSTSISMSK